MEQLDFYALLDIKKHASEDTIRKAYLLGCKKYHPDRLGSNTAFNQLHTAYKTLTDRKLRGIYDSNYYGKHKKGDEMVLDLEGSSFFRGMEMARRMTLPGARKINECKQKIETLFRCGSLRFNEGVPCDGESCSARPHNILRVSDPSLLPDNDTKLFICMKHKYLHHCNKECSENDSICPIFAWYKVSRWYRRKRGKALLPEKTNTRPQHCSELECKPRGKDDKKRGFVDLGENIWTCIQHKRPHICHSKQNINCDFAENTKPGVLVCWATNHIFTVLIYQDKMGVLEASGAPFRGADGMGRLRLLSDNSVTFVPWGLNIGEEIPEIENLPMGELAKKEHTVEQEKKEKSLRLESQQDQDEVTHKDDSIYHRYIGILAKPLDTDRLGDYVTLHHGRAGNSESSAGGGTGFEGYEDDEEDQIAFDSTSAQEKEQIHRQIEQLEEKKKLL